MLKNYWKVALRYLLRYKGYTAINILGLSVGFTCCTLIMLFVRNEFSYDRWQTKADRICRAWINEKYEGKDFINTVTPIPMGPALQAGLPDVEVTCRVYPFNGLVKFAGGGFNESVHMVDANFFQVFDFPLKKGSRQNAFPNDHSIILTESVAKKYFGEKEALGQTLELQLGDEKVLFTVTGITATGQLQSSIRPDILIPFANDIYFWSEKVRTRAWSQVFAETYVLLRKGAATASVEKNYPPWSSSCWAAATSRAVITSTSSRLPPFTWIPRCPPASNPSATPNILISCPPSVCSSCYSPVSTLSPSPSAALPQELWK